MHTGNESMPERNDRLSEDNGRPTCSGERRSNIVDDALLGRQEPCDSLQEEVVEETIEPERERIVRGCCDGDGIPDPITEAASSSGNMREVRITKLNYGYIVTVGCQKFAIETPETVVEKLGEYLKDPLATEKKWFNGKLF